MASVRQRRNIYILAFTLAVVTLGVGVVIPIMPFYMEKMGAGGAELGLLVASYALMRLIFGPIWGSLSDHHGRRPIMLIGVLGYALTMVWFGLATQLWMLFMARIVSGILSSATSPTTMAYVGDSTPQEERGSGMGILGAAIGLGTILGPALGGLLAGRSLSAPFFIAAALSLLAMALIALFLPESLPSEARQPHREKHAFNWNVSRTLIFGPLSGLLVMAFVMTCGMMLFFGIFGLYALKKFKCGPDEVGIVFMGRRAGFGSCPRSAGRPADPAPGETPRNQSRNGWERPRFRGHAADGQLPDHAAGNRLFHAADVPADAGHHRAYVPVRRPATGHGHGHERRRHEPGTHCRARCWPDLLSMRTFGCHSSAAPSSCRSVLFSAC